MRATRGVEPLSISCYLHASMKTGNQNDAPWFSGGLYFRCIDNCGACCISHGDYEYVYLQESDIPRLAEHLDLEPERFLEKYTFEEEGWRVLNMDQPHCPFLQGTRCAVHKARPVQCRTFPFWEEFLETEENWEELMSFCPGIGKGRRYTLGHIRRQLGLRETD